MLLEPSQFPSALDQTLLQRCKVATLAVLASVLRTKHPTREEVLDKTVHQVRKKAQAYRDMLLLELAGLKKSMRSHRKELD